MGEVGHSIHIVNDRCIKLAPNLHQINSTINTELALVTPDQACQDVVDDSSSLK